MTFRPDIGRSSVLLSLLLLASGCGDAAPELAPIERAKAELSAGDGLDAELVLKEMLERDTSAPEVAAYLGEAALLQGDLAKARRWLAPREFSEETAAHGFQLLGRLEMREGNLPAAGQAFDRAFQFSPEDPVLWVDIGRLRYLGGEQLQAIEAAEQALRFGPEDPVALRFRGQLARDAQGPVAALDLFERALEVAPDDTVLLTDYAATLGELGRATDALEAIRRVAQIAPDAPRIHYLQAVIAARAGNGELARSLLLRATDEEREQPAAQLLSGILDIEAGNYASATQTLDRLFRRQPDNMVVRRLLARALLLSGGERELIARFDRAASQASAPPYLKTIVARAHEALADRTAAAPLLDEAALGRNLRLVPLPSGTPSEAIRASNDGGGPATRDLIREFIRLGEDDLAVRRASELGERFPGSGDALSLLGDARLARGDERGALEAYNRASMIRRTWPLARRLMVAHLASDNRAAADAVLRDFLTSGRRTPEAGNLYARALARRGEWQEAADLLDAAIVHGGSRSPDVLAMRSEAAARLGDRAGALDFAWRAYRLQPLYPPAVAALANTSDNEEVVARMQAKLGALQRMAR